jgi:signal transduction histidine kinase
MSLRTRIVLFNAFVLALAVLAAGIALAGFWGAVAPLRQAVADETRAVELARALREELAREAATISVVLAAGGGEEAYRAANDRFDRLLSTAAALAADRQAQHALEQARTAETEFNVLIDQALALSVDRSIAVRYLVESVMPARDQADTALDRFLERQEIAARAAERQTALTALFAIAAVVALLAVAGIAGAMLSLGFSRFLLDRLSSLVSATRRVASGDRAAQVPVPAGGGDELDQLGRAFNSMVTQLGEAERAARRVDELKSSFLASISHDLRTPLTTVRGLLETLRREDAQWDEATKREFLEVAHKESDRLTRLVGNLLDLSRLEAGAWPLDREAVDLPALARRLRDDLALSGGPLARHHVRVVAHDAPLAWADEQQIRRVLENLLTNAAKFAPAGTEIRVLVKAHGPVSPATSGTLDGSGAPAASELVLVRVEDRGPGVPQADTERIFEKFYRVAGQSASSGTGLGLAICRGIVEAHGGHLWVQAATPGDDESGAAFCFTLSAVAAPAATANPAAAQRRTAPPEPAAATPATAGATSP